MKQARSEITFRIDLYFEKAFHFVKLLNWCSELDLRLADSLQASAPPSQHHLKALELQLKLDLRSKNGSENDLCSSHQRQRF